MPSKKELLEAKQILSARLLRAGLKGQVVGRGYTLRVSAAIAAVSHGIPTDVIESPPAFILARKTKAKKRTAATASAAKVSTACTRNRKKRQRPIVAGISAAHYQVTAGTIAYFCKSTRVGDDPGRVFVLSNNHVFADVNHGLAGDDLYQPGPADGGTPADHFAELHRYVAIQLGGIVPNRVDAAIGSLLPKVEYRAELCRIGRISETGRATEHMRVRKHGRTSGLTEGIVTDESYDALVGMDHNDPSVVALFEDQMRIERVPPWPWFGLGWHPRLRHPALRECGGRLLSRTPGRRAERRARGAEARRRAAQAGARARRASQSSDLKLGRRPPTPLLPPRKRLFAHQAFVIARNLARAVRRLPVARASAINNTKLCEAIQRHLTAHPFAADTAAGILSAWAAAAGLRGRRRPHRRNARSAGHRALAARAQPA